MGMRLRALLLEGDAVVEGLGAIAALWDEVEADTTDVFLGTEVLEAVYLVALYFEFHQAPVAQTDTVALAQMAVDDMFGLFLDPVFHRSFFGDKDTNKRAKSQKNFEVFRAGVFSSFQLKDTNKQGKTQIVICIY